MLKERSKEYGLPDLERFVQVGNRSLLIKGKSGTGKETLCFELAGNNVKDYNAIFITRNQTDKVLYRRFPWIKEFVLPSNIIEISTQDSIMNDPSFVISSIVNSVANLSKKVVDPFLSSENPKRPFIILDVWDSVSREMNPIERMRGEKLLTSLAEKYDGFLIFLSEQTDTASLEYLMDGVIETSQQYYKTYRIREASLEKLKGVPIRRPKVPFTLQNGRFKAFTRLRYEKQGPSRFVPTAGSEFRFSSGNSDLDSRLGGGFKLGSVIGIEIESDVDRFALVPLLSPLALNFLSQDNPVLISSSADQGIDSIVNYLLPYLGEEKLNKIKIFGHGFGSSSEYVVEREEIDFESAHATWSKAYERLKEEKRPLLMSIDYSFVELAYPSQEKLVLKAMIENARNIRHNKDLMIIISRPGFESLEVMKSVCDLHFRIFDHEGTTFVAALKPQLFLCNMQSSFKSGYPQLILEDSV